MSREGVNLMRKIIGTIAAIVLLGALIPSAVASPRCNGYLDFNPQFDGFRNAVLDKQLGYQCQMNVNQGWDMNFADARDGFQGTDNDAMSSFHFYGVPGETWCLTMWEHKAASGKSLVYRSYNGADILRWDMPSGWNDRVSSILFERKSTLGARCP